MDLGDEVGAQRRRRAQRHVRAKTSSHRDTDTEFFPQFARQRDSVGLTGRHLSARKFPQASQLGRSSTLGNEQRTVVDQRSGDHDQMWQLVWHLVGQLVWHCRERYTVKDMAVLTDDQIDAALPGLDGWQRSDGALRRSIKFPAFLDGIDAVHRVAAHAEAQDHHPDIDIRWRTVTFALVTHSEGGITDKDVAMAADINRIVGQ